MNYSLIFSIVTRETILENWLIVPYFNIDAMAHQHNRLFVKVPTLRNGNRYIAKAIHKFLLNLSSMMSVGCNIKYRVVDSITLLAIPLRLLFEKTF